MGESKISQADLEKVADFYDSVRELYKRNSINYDTQLQLALEEKIRDEMYELSQSLSNDDLNEMGKVYVAQTKFNLFDFCLEKLLNYLCLYDEEAVKVLFLISEEMKGVFEGVCKYSSQVTRRASKLKTDLKQQQQETEQVLQAAELLEKTTQELNQQRQELLKQIDEARNENKETIVELEQENRRYLDQVIRMAKQSAQHQIFSPMRTPRKSRASPSLMSPRVPKPQPKPLSLKQLKDFIEEVFAAKHNHDLKCHQNKQPRETLSQFIPTFLKKKYGLKSLITEWTSSVFKALEKYSYEIDVKLFSKMLNNEVNEQYYFVFKQVKETMVQLYKQYIRTKFPYMQEKAIKELFSDVWNQNLDEEAWNYVVSNLYSVQDQRRLCSEIQKQTNPKKSKRVVSFQALANIVLRFQLEGYEELIQPLLRRLSSKDTDNDGVLSTEEFRELVKDLSLQEETSHLLKALDPFQVGSITFSDILNVLNEQETRFSSIQKSPGQDKQTKLL